MNFTSGATYSFCVFVFIDLIRIFQCLTPDLPSAYYPFCKDNISIKKRQI